MNRRHLHDISDHIGHLEDKKARLVAAHRQPPYDSPTAEIMIGRFIEGVSVSDLATRHKVTVSDVERHIQLTLMWHGTVDGKQLHQLGIDDPDACLDLLAIIMDHNHRQCRCCHKTFGIKHKGRIPDYCSSACRQKAYRRRASAPGYIPAEQRTPTPVQITEGLVEHAFALPRTPGGWTRKAIPEAVTTLERLRKGEHPAVAGVRARSGQRNSANNTE